MNDEFLKTKLRRVIRRYRWVAMWRALAACWAGATLVGLGLVWLQSSTGWTSSLSMPLLAGIAGAVATVVAIRQFLKEPDYRWIAKKIEDRHPELKGVLLTAVQQSFEPSADAGFLQYRVLQEATSRSQEKDWRNVVPTGRLFAMQLVHVAALACFVFALGALRVKVQRGGGMFAKEGGTFAADGVTVSPGDASVERGDSLVVLATFARTLPPTVGLVIREANAPARTVPLVKSLADPVFGGSVTEVANDFTYHLEYRGERTKDFKVTVYEHPKLVRADVDLTFPDYTKLPPKHIEDTRRVSAVEGTKIDYALQLNKPVKSAKLVARDGKKTEIVLQTEPGKAVATLPAHVPEKTQTYDLLLVDADGRKNKVASPFTIDVQANRPPEIRLTTPRGDARPSALEEVAFDGTVFDDFGSPAYGLAYNLAGAEPKFIELGREVPAKEKRPFNHLMKLEELGVKPDDLISWYAWADDIGPDGKLRRTSGDLFFAEVRPFDEIFREQQQGGGEQGGGGGGGGGGQQRQRLTDLQKQVINATWRLQREGATPKYADDVKVVSDGQEQALGMAQEAAGEARAPREQALWTEAIQQMEKAIEKLKDAAKSPGPLAQALPPEQAAYQAVLKLQGRETNVTRGGRGGGGGGGGGGNQRQIDQLDLQQAQNRYETQRQARSPQNAERREQLAVMNKLQELARRQQDLNERLKELQTSLQEARTPREQEDIRRQLKRLEEEQRQMVADTDEVRQRMDRAENQSNMADQRQQLDQTREDLQRAADAIAGDNAAQALASGTRAQRQLQQARDDMRKENSSQFAEDMREMRSEARELSQQQEQLAQKLDSMAAGNSTQRKSLTDSGERKEALDKLAEQKERMNKLVDQAKQVSEQAENTEPLLSRQLEESVRKLTQDDTNTVKEARRELVNTGRYDPSLVDRLQRTMDGEASGKTLDLTSEMLREGYLPQASQSGQRARSGIDDLRRGIERAAESVLGDDAEQLKLVSSELDQITDQLQREIAQALGGAQPGQQAGGQQQGQQPGGQPGDQRQAGTQPGQNGQGQQPGEANAEGQQPGQNGQQEGQGQQPGQRGGRGQQGQGLANAGQQPGQQPGQEGQPGEQPGGQPGGQPGDRQASADGQQPGQQGQGQQGQQGQGGQGQAGQGGRQGRGGQQGRGGERLAGNQGGRNQQGGNRGGLTVEDVLNGGNRRDGGGGGGGARGDLGGVWNDGPLLGDNFRNWSDRLNDVETLLDSPELRNAVAAARERAAQFRREANRDLKKPDWTVVELQILKPLVEVRSRVAEELARRDTKESLVPIDRDPVPNRFAESVRRYYEELGKDKAEVTRE